MGRGGGHGARLNKASDLIGERQDDIHHGLHCKGTAFGLSEVVPSQQRAPMRLQGASLCAREIALAASGGVLLLLVAMIMIIILIIIIIIIFTTTAYGDLKRTGPLKQPLYLMHKRKNRHSITSSSNGSICFIFRFFTLSHFRISLLGQPVCL